MKAEILLLITLCISTAAGFKCYSCSNLATEHAEMTDELNTHIREGFANHSLNYPKDSGACALNPAQTEQKECTLYCVSANLKLDFGKYTGPKIEGEDLAQVGKAEYTLRGCLDDMIPDMKSQMSDSLPTFNNGESACIEADGLGWGLTTTGKFCACSGELCNGKAATKSLPTVATTEKKTPAASFSVFECMGMYFSNEKLEGLEDVVMEMLEKDHSDMLPSATETCFKADSGNNWDTVSACKTMAGLIGMEIDLSTYSGSSIQMGNSELAKSNIQNLGQISYVVRGCLDFLLDGHNMTTIKSMPEDNGCINATGTFYGVELKTFACACNSEYCNDRLVSGASSLRVVGISLAMLALFAIGKNTFEIF